MRRKSTVHSSRFTISFVLFSLFFISSFAQKKQYTKYAEDAVADGDFYGAAFFYEKLYTEDSNDISLAYKLATCYLNYNAYKKAYPLFEKVYASPQKVELINALYYMAMINKYQENYELSVQQFAKFLKEAKERSSFVYQSAAQEMKASKIIPYIIHDTLKYSVYHLSGLNSPDAEFSAVQLNDSMLYYSALRMNKDKEYVVKIYAGVNREGWWNEDTLLENINTDKINSANGTFNIAKNKFVFSRCSDLKFCKLAESYLTDSGWSKPVLLPDEINLTDSTNTHPFIVNTDGKEILLFASNRTGGKGGMDIWYSEFSKGKYNMPKNLGAKINSAGNEITPFYNVKDTSLYFSSDWHTGIGGQDIFRSKGSLFSLTEPVNIGIPLNSSRNDQSFVVDTSGNGFLSSTRAGTLSEDSNAVCCADIYRFEKMKEKSLPEDTLPLRMEEDYVETKVVLFFHNDEPNPRTRDTLTRLNYVATYAAYKKLLPDYEKLYPANLKDGDREMALEDIHHFFENYVDEGMINLKRFSEELLTYLEKGYSAEVVVKGFASPLTKSDYNVNLSLRRISSFINYLKEYGKGEYLPYLNGSAENGARLTILKEPNGEFKAREGVSDDYYDVRNSIYSPFAAMERRIEVVSVKLIPKEKKELAYNDDFKKVIVDLGDVTGAIVSNKIYLKNTGNEAWEVERLGADCSCTKIAWADGEIKPGENLEISFSIDLANKLGPNKNILMLKKSDSRDYQLVELRYNVVRK